MQIASRYSRRIAASLQQSQHHFGRKLVHVVLDIDRLPAAFLGIAFKLAFLEPVQKCPHRRVWSAESGVQAIVETLGQVGCPRSTMVKMSPHGRRKFASDPSILEILRQRLSPCVEVGTAHWRNLQYVPYDRDAKRWKQAH